MVNLLFVMAGGALGSGLRYCVGFLPFDAGILPWSTLMVNLAGSFVLGALAAYGQGTDSTPRPLMLFLGPGLCGGFTTYSAFAVETTAMLERHDVLSFAAYSSLTFVGGILMAFLGFSIARSTT
ncbi:MAG: CrcB family protein [Candidatus Kapabacteria bacterium]|nr:CrcB family protein [Candidatus Kapabacteria bacterium]